jgi:hypothetical protein
VRVKRTKPVTWVAAGIEVGEDRRHTWVALAGADGHRAVVQLEDPLEGTLVTAALVAMWERHGLEWLAVDPRSPSATLVEPLQQEGMPLRLPDTADVAAAHGHFLDLLYAGRLKIRGHPALDAAVRLAETRKLAGAVAVDRYAEGDAGPLYAAQLACWALGDPEQAEGIEPGVWAI